MFRPTLVLRGACAAAVALLLFSVVPAAQTSGSPERYIATAVNLGEPGPTGPWTVEMVVTRWSTDKERDQLIDVLLSKGPDEMLKMLQRMPRTGYIRTPDSIGYDLHFARKMPTEEGGERVFLATDRYISYWEAANRPRTIDYPFTYLELRLDKDGMGEGKMSIFTKVTVDKKTNAIVLENYGTQPVLLQNVHREPAKA
jgi:hypothetical protein